MTPLRIPRDLGAARDNLLAKARRSRLADTRPMPRTAIAQNEHFTLYRYAPDDEARPHGRPLFLTPPLAAPAMAFDLRRGCSVAEYFIEDGRDVYLVDYGPVDFGDRDQGIEHWVDEVLPQALTLASEDAHGVNLHMAGWSLGGIFTMFTAAARQDLPIATATAVASPFDLRRVPLLALARPLDRAFGGLVGPAYRAVGGVPAPLTKWGFQLSAADKYLTKPLSILTHADDRDFLAQLEAVDRFMDNMYAYPGRTFGQLYHVVMRTNEFATGTMRLGGRPVHLADIDVPVLVVAGLNDTLAPTPAVAHLLDLVTGSPSTQLLQAPGGHLGVLTGRAARKTTWPGMEGFFSKFD
ncbi:MAG: alpha/beta hydrolase [Aeromicrobium sp.]|uniref:alpha/beta hydrolase n=1 Tax=Aeromicrobium sp. TaxID=1871063 RepID=UPI0039E45293